MYRKHDLGEKLLSVSLYESGRSSEFIGRELGVDPREILRWLARYRRFGISGFEKQPYTCATADFKTQVVRSVVEKTLSCDAAVLEYGVSRSAIRSWVKQVRSQGYESLSEHKPRGRPPKTMGHPKKQKPQTELEKLRARNEWLEAENALLKKVRALVEERIARESGKKRTPSKD